MPSADSSIVDHSAIADDAACLFTSRLKL